MESAVPRSIIKMQYAVARLPLALVQDGIARYWSNDAPIRVGFERWLGSLDVFVGRLLADDEITQRGQALLRHTGDLAQAGRPPRDAPAQSAGFGHVPPGTQARRTGTVAATFILPADVQADTVALCGEFNDWSAEATQLERRSDGSWRATVALEPGRSYRYRYLLDGQRWENDSRADRYVPNDQGSIDSVIVVE